MAKDAARKRIKYIKFIASSIDGISSASVSIAVYSLKRDQLALSKHHRGDLGAGILLSTLKIIGK